MAQQNQNQKAEQERIKAAVSDVSESITGGSEEPQTTESPMQGEGMQPSMFSSTDIEEPQAQEPAPEQSNPSPYPAESYQDYSQYNYQPQASAESSDIISEIAEQIVAEKTSLLKSDLEKMKDSRTTMDAKLENLSERLQRIEKTIDKLQLSILQKVGDYVSNVETLKTELIETQKSFKVLHGKHKSKEHPEQREHKYKKG